MSTQTQRRYTLEEYFALELASEEKYEYFDGVIFNMSGASPAHERVVMNITINLSLMLRGRPCLLFSSNVRVKVPSATPYRYPDLTAVCDTPRYEKIGGIEALTNPSLLVEVLSSSTEAYDRGDKFTNYKSIESLSEYLLVAQHRPHITHYSKTDNGRWSYEEINGLDGSIALVALGCELELREVYEDVEFLPLTLPPLER